MVKPAETGDRPEGEGPKEKVLSTGKIAVNPPAKKSTQNHNRNTTVKN